MEIPTLRHIDVEIGPGDNVDETGNRFAANDL